MAEEEMQQIAASVASEVLGPVVRCNRVAYHDGYEVSVSLPFEYFGALTVEKPCSKENLEHSFRRLCLEIREHLNEALKKAEA